MEDLGLYVDRVISDKTAGRKFKFLLRDKSIATKNSVVPDFILGQDKFELFTVENPQPDTASRMATFDTYALIYGSKVATEAIEKAKLQCKDITHIITVSCTGMSAPGLEIQLSIALGLNNSVKRYAVNFMGCYAAFHALRLAQHIIRADDKEANVLIVSVELCSLHFRNDNSDDNLLSTFLFSDGAAAAIVSSRSSDINPMLQLMELDTALVPEGKGDMSWQIGNTGFEMVLNKNVPIYLKENMAKVFETCLGNNSITPNSINHFAIHPGGKNILKAFEEALSLPSEALQHSYDVLLHGGNMSSATILFVMQKYLESKQNLDNEVIYAAAFGPGLTVENALLRIKNPTHA